MIEKIKKLIAQNNMCVLATCHENKPHCSLMAYLADERAETIYMVTRKETHKYKYLIENPQVSLLIDTRTQKSPEERGKVQALTISGTCSPVENQVERDSIRSQIVIHHPHLRALADHPDAAIIAVQLDSFLLLDGAMKAHHLSRNGK